MVTQLPMGTEVAGHRIEAFIGRGGMGVVYLAEHLRLRRRVALKVLTPDLANDETFRARFIRESQIAASLDHPNVVTVYDAGEAEGLLYISMRYVDGPNLGTTIRQEAALSPEFTVSVIDQMAGALDAAHALGLVHRDVKPANILLSQPGSQGGARAYLTDFGITKRIGAATQFTQTGQVVGTYTYMAPEQIRGDSLDGRTDIYSLACIVFECLTGRPPFGGQSPMELMFAHMNQAPPSLLIRRPELPPAIDLVIQRGLAKAKDDRYQTGAELAAALGQAVGGQAPATAVPTGATGPPAQTEAGSGVAANAPTALEGTPSAQAPAAGYPPAPSVPSMPSMPSAPAASVPGPPMTRPAAPPPQGLDVPLAGTVAVPQAPAGGPPPRKGGRALAVVLVAALVLGGGAAAFLLLGKGKSTTTTSGSPRPGHSSNPSSPTGQTGPETGPTGGPTSGPVVRDWRRISSDDFGGPGNQTMNRVLATGSGAVAVGYDGPPDDLDAAAWFSSNGRSWTEASVPHEPGDQGIAAVAEGGPGFVGVGTDASTGDENAAVWTSPDGSTWNLERSEVFGGPGDQSMRRVVVAPPGLVAVGYDGSAGDLDAAVWLFDGQTWSIQHSPSFGGSGDQEIRSAVTFKGGLVAVGDDTNGDGQDGAVWRFDGTSWTRVQSSALGGPGDQFMITVEHGGPGLVAVGYEFSNGSQDAVVWISSDGADWRRVADPGAFGGPGDQAMLGVVSTESGLVAAGFDDGTTDAVIWTSSDGRRWTRRDIGQLGGPGQQQIKGIASLGRDLLAVGRIRTEGGGGRDENAAVWLAEPA